MLLWLSGLSKPGEGMAAILITEDEAQVRVLSESFLQDQGQRTLSAGSPEEALALLDETDDIECLFTDIELRGDVQAGLDLAQAAVKKQPGLRVLYTSCHSLTDGMKALLSRTQRCFRSRTRSTSFRPFLLSSSASSHIHPRCVPQERTARRRNCDGFPTS
jgi:CheY-like chemotaxis protein